MEQPFTAYHPKPDGKGALVGNWVDERELHSSTKTSRYEVRASGGEQPPNFYPAPSLPARPSRAPGHLVGHAHERSSARRMGAGYSPAGLGGAKGSVGRARGSIGLEGAGGPHRSLRRRRAPTRRPSTRRRRARGPRLTFSPVSLPLRERKDSEAQDRG